MQDKLLDDKTKQSEDKIDLPSSLSRLGSSSSISDIAGILKSAIHTGEIRDGSPLPTIRTLADAIGVNRNTVASAYRSLSEMGLIEGKGRQGSRARSPGPVSSARLEQGIYDLAGGNPDPLLLPDFNKMLASVPLRARNYEDAPINKDLIDVVDAIFKRDSIPSGQIWLANGTFDALQIILRVSLSAGDAIAVEDPCFLTTVGLLREAGYKGIAMPVDAGGVTPDALKAALAQNVKAVILTPRAHNPMGGSWTPERRDDLLKVMRDHPDVLLIEDDHFAPLSSFAPVTLVEERQTQWAVIRSVSKYLGADLRCAFVNSSPQLAKAANNFAAVTFRWVSGIQQSAVLSALTSSDFETMIANASKAYASRRQHIIKALAGYEIDAFGADGINVWVPVDDEQLMYRHLLQHGWIVRAGSIFRMVSDQAIRISTSTMTEAMATELARQIATVHRMGNVERGA